MGLTKVGLNSGVVVISSGLNSRIWLYVFLEFSCLYFCVINYTSNFLQEFEAYKKHTSALLKKEKELNERLRHLCG